MKIKGSQPLESPKQPTTNSIVHEVIKCTSFLEKVQISSQALRFVHWNLVHCSSSGLYNKLWKWYMNSQSFHSPVLIKLTATLFLPFYRPLTTNMEIRKWFTKAFRKLNSTIQTKLTAANLNVKCSFDKFHSLVLVETETYSDKFLNHLSRMSLFLQKKLHWPFHSSIEIECKYLKYKRDIQPITL